MRKTLRLTLIGALGLSLPIIGCAQGTSLDNSVGGGGSGNEGGNASGGGGNGGGGGTNNCHAEVCDGMDNDCDGQVDEGCECMAGQTESCYSGPPNTADVGQCKSGTHTCDTKTYTFGPCMNDVVPALEICNGQDDDCNGMVDEGVADLMCGIGACMVVAPGCVNGAPGTCVPGQPALEICDGIDNDCDQLTDESFPENNQSCDTGIPGICAMGTSMCTAGALTCQQINMPAMEQCDGIDNDCDGTIDNNILGLGTGCTTSQVGVCSAGTYTCKNGVIDCFPDKAPSAEICDGLDNDCNGKIDDKTFGEGGACMTGMSGNCAAGKQTCSGGMFICQPTALSQPELCNGLDDNCNGQIDEGNPGNGMSCSCGGTAGCSAGQIVCQGCTKEVICNNGINDDNDSGTDCTDSDCALGCSGSVAPCPAGQTLLVLSGTDVPKAIPDASTLNNTITFSETMTVKRVVMQLNITHTYDADLLITLLSPNNTAVIMANSRGFASDNYTNTIFNDGCGAPISSGSAPFSGCYSPEQPLAGFANVALNGAWTLRVKDQTNGDTGTLNSWTLAICAQ